MKYAVITGATSGIGLACAKKLLELNYKVFAIGRDFDKCSVKDENFIEIKADLSDTLALKTIKKQVEAKNIHILIHSAGVGYFAPHEELSEDQIERMIAVNFTSSMILTKQFLRELKKNSGHIFFISSLSAIESSPYGALYGATKAALRHFASSLFEEGRKSGLKVISINPGFVKTSFFDNLHFGCSDDELSYIEPADVAQTIENVLQLRDGTLMSDITLKPQKFKIQKKKRV